MENNPVESSKRKIRHECRLCGNVYTNKKELVKHKERHIKQCDICDRKFIIERDLILHKKGHCDVCGKSFKKEP